MKKFQTLCLFLCLFFVAIAASARDLKEGMKGEDVRQWQLFLVKKGYMQPPALGTFSKRTLKATVAFQKRNGLQGLGMVGPKTIAKAKALGFGSSTGAPQQSQTNGAYNTTVSADMRKRVQVSVAKHLRHNTVNESSIKILGNSKVMRMPNSTPTYTLRVKYSVRSMNGALLYRDKLYICDKNARVTAVRDAEEFGFD